MILAATVWVPTLPTRKLSRPTRQPRGGIFLPRPEIFAISFIINAFCLAGRLTDRRPRTLSLRLDYDKPAARALGTLLRKIFNMTIYIDVPEYNIRGIDDAAAL